MFNFYTLDFNLLFLSKILLLIIIKTSTMKKALIFFLLLILPSLSIAKIKIGLKHIAKAVEFIKQDLPVKKREISQDCS